MTRTTYCAFLFALLLCIAPLSRCKLCANNVTFGITGTVTSVDSALSSQFAVGNTLQGTYTFNDADVDTSAPSDIGLYENPFTAASVSFSNGYTATYNSSASKLIIVDDSGNPDRYDVFIPVNGAAVNGFTVNLFEFLLIDNQNTMLTSDDLPLTPPNLALAESADGFLRFTSGSSLHFVNFDVTSLTLVPEPSTATLLIALSALLMPTRRRPGRYSDTLRDA